MKKLMCIMLALLAAPAMAGVTISIVDNGDLTADIVAVADGDDADANGSLVAGIAIDVSVDPGAIVDVVGFKATGESIVGDAGYGIFLGTIIIENDAITDTGTPVAPEDAPGAAGALGGPAITLELGALYDQATPEAAPEATTVLCTIVVSEECNATITANATRGGAVLIGGGDPSAVDLVGGPITGGPVICDALADATEAQLALYEALSEADQAIWCYQCFDRGDSNGDCGLTFTDVNAVINTWPDAANPTKYSANADFNKDGAITFTDVNVLITNWPNPGAGTGGCDASCDPI